MPNEPCASTRRGACEGTRPLASSRALVSTNARRKAAACRDGSLAGVPCSCPALIPTAFGFALGLPRPATLDLDGDRPAEECPDRHKERQDEDFAQCPVKCYSATMSEAISNSRPMSSDLARINR